MNRGMKKILLALVLMLFFVCNSVAAKQITNDAKLWHSLSSTQKEAFFWGYIIGASSGCGFYIESGEGYQAKYDRCMKLVAANERSEFFLAKIDMVYTDPKYAHIDVSIIVNAITLCLQMGKVDNANFFMVLDTILPK